jgi:serine/threonine-protein kinase
MKETKGKKEAPRPAEQLRVSKIGRYDIVREMGRGAMGIVYEAVDPVIQRKVALKTIRFDRFSSGEELDELRTRFQHEAQAAGGLSHPNIVTIYDVGTDQDATFIAMEFIEGDSLEHLIATKRKWPIETVLSLVSRIGEALEYAHEKGIIHRDVKPANILVDHAGRPRIVDFGIARLSSSTMTRTSMTLGTPSYMAPEQIAGQRVDKRADIFSLGVILYEMLTYQKPFAGSDVTTIIFKIMQQDPPLPRAIEREIPKGLEYVIMKTLSKNPADRPQSCRELIADLADYRKFDGLKIPKSAPLSAPAPDSAEPTPAAKPEDSRPAGPSGDTAPPQELTDTVTIRKPAALAASAVSPAGPSAAAAKKPKPLVLAAVVGGIALIVAAVLLFRPSGTPKAEDGGGAQVVAVEEKPTPTPVDAAAAKTAPILKNAAASNLVDSPKPAAGGQKPPAADAGGAQKPAAPAGGTPAKTGAEAQPGGANPIPPKSAPTVGGASQNPEKAESPVRIYTMPKIVKMVEAVYPEKAIKDKIEGLIVLEVTADREGRVTNAKVLRSIPALDEAAIQAVMQWRYEPQLVRGRPRAFICSATVRFKRK